MKIGTQPWGRCGDPLARTKLGVTLVEIMIAISVLLIAVAGTTASQVSSNRLAATASETSAAMSDLQACMEQVMLVSLDELPIAGSTFEDGVAIAAYDGLHLDGESIVATYPGYAGGDVPDPLEILLTITFQDHQGRTRSMRIASMKTR